MYFLSIENFVLSNPLLCLSAAVFLALLLVCCSKVIAPIDIPTDEPANPERSEFVELSPTVPATADKPKLEAPPTVIPLPTEEQKGLDMAAPTPESPQTQALIDQAKSLLSEYLDIDEGQIEFVQFELVTWPDGGLGCPQPGMAYIQIMVEGYRIQLSYDGQVYDFHGGSSTDPFLCQDGKPRTKVTPAGGGHE